MGEDEKTGKIFLIKVEFLPPFLYIYEMKYPKTYHLEWSKGTNDDDKVQYDLSGIIGCPIIITEKLDGSNACITKGGIYGRSHAEYSRNPWDREMWNIHNKIGDSLHDGLQIFGENMEGIHSIEYKNLKSYFYIFGIREYDRWLSWEEVEEYSYLLDLPVVPILYKGITDSVTELKKLTESFMQNDSKLGGELEGLVVRKQGDFYDTDFETSVLKMVRSNHVQTDENWKRNWKRSVITF